METTGKEGPTRAGPSAAQGGTKNTRRRQPPGRGGGSRAADGPPPSSSAAGTSRCSLPECEYPAQEHVTKSAFKSVPKDEIHWSFILSVTQLIDYKRKTELHLSIRINRCGSTVWRHHDKRAKRLHKCCLLWKNSTHPAAFSWPLVCHLISSVHVLCVSPKGHLLKIAWHQLCCTRALKPHQPIRSRVQTHLHIYGSKILLIQHVT